MFTSAATEPATWSSREAMSQAYAGPGGGASPQEKAPALGSKGADVAGYL
jgi:hypothetical protein